VKLGQSAGLAIEEAKQRGNMILIRHFLAMLVLAGLVAACGVRGDPEPPPGSDPEKNKDRSIVLDKII
jgi:hypothetical protein